MLFFSGLMVKITWPYTSFKTDIDFLLSKQNKIHIDYWLIGFYIHIFSSLPLLIIGILQFILPLRDKKLHRKLGKIYAFIIVFFAAPSGFILAIHANGGSAAKISFTLLSVFWFLTTLAGWMFALNKKFLLHQIAMKFSYALTLSAIILRLLVFFLPKFSNIHGTEMYVLVSWLSWLPSMVILSLYYFVKYPQLKKTYLLH